MPTLLLRQIKIRDFCKISKLQVKIMATRQSSDINSFRRVLNKAKNIIVMTGAGISAESGIPTFRGSGGYWRKYDVATLATPEAFRNNPSLVWEFYNYRRAVALGAKPNAAHIAIANFEARHKNKKITVITQNVDGLHARAGSKNLIELHGNLFKTRCCKCKRVEENYDLPICEALGGQVGEPTGATNIPVASLPHCKDKQCRGLLRPNVVWFGENLEKAILEKTESAFAECDVCMVVGTSCIVYPAAMFAPQAADRGATVAEFNIEKTKSSHKFQYHFPGPCATTIPQALTPYDTKDWQKEKEK